MYTTLLDHVFPSIYSHSNRGALRKGYSFERENGRLGNTRNISPTPCDKIVRPKNNRNK